MATRRTLVLALSLCAPVPAVSQPTAPAVTVTAAWARATPPGATTGAVYMTLTSTTPDTLISATTPAAKSAQVHEMLMDGTIMRMREMPAGLPLPAAKPVTLAPGGYHLMLTGLAAPLTKGQTIHLRLAFAHAPPVAVDVPVGAIGAMAPGGANGS